MSTPNGPFVSTGNLRLLEDAALALQSALEAFAQIRTLAADIPDEALQAAIDDVAYEAGVGISLTPVYTGYCPDCVIP